jgi:competence protein ComGC
MQTAEKLVRKQFLIFPKQVKKLELLAKKQKTSAAEMVRCAIDAYDIDAQQDMEESELLELVSARVKEAIADTQNIRKRLDNTFKELKIEGA